MRAEAEKRTMDFCKKEQLGLLPPPDEKMPFSWQNASTIAYNGCLKDGSNMALHATIRGNIAAPHKHSFIEMVYVVKGNCTHIISGKNIVIEEGELLFLSQHTIHGVNKIDKDSLVITIIFLPELLESIYANSRGEGNQINRFFFDCLRNDEYVDSYLHFKVRDAKPIQNLVENLIENLIGGDPSLNDINRLTMELLFLHLQNYTEYLMSSSADERIITKVLHYVSESYKDGSLTKLSDMLHYSTSSLSRLITQKTGKSFTELMQNQKLSQACYLLKHSDMTVSEISVEVGYENISFFHRLFKSKYGVSPHKYKKSLL